MRLLPSHLPIPNFNWQQHDHNPMKSENYIITPPKVFSGFAFGKNYIYVVAFVKYKNYEIKSSFTLFMGHGLASRKFI